jgi:hypothetical protein
MPSATEIATRAEPALVVCLTVIAASYCLMRLSDAAIALLLQVHLVIAILLAGIGLSATTLLVGKFGPMGEVTTWDVVRPLCFAVMAAQCWLDWFHARVFARCSGDLPRKEEE